MEDGRAEIPLGVTVQGDVLIVIYHARSTLGGRLQAKVADRLPLLMSSSILFIYIEGPWTVLSWPL